MNKENNNELLQKMMSKDSIKVTSPLLPELNEFTELLKDIWDCRPLWSEGHLRCRACLWGGSPPAPKGGGFCPACWRYEHPLVSCHQGV